MLSRERLSRFRSQVDQSSEVAARFVEACTLSYMASNPGASVAEARDYTISAINSSLNIFGDEASALAASLFEELAMSAGLNLDAKIYDVIDPEMVDRKVRYLAQRLVDGDKESFNDGIRDVTKYYVRRCAQENMTRNCEEHEVRYARVPSGLETCAWCFMLSSRGFVYRSEKKAGVGHEFHANCDCVIVPGFADEGESMQVEGYDPKGMRKRLDMCARSIGIDDVDSAITSSERRKLVLSEVATRDFKWLYTGTEPEYVVLPGAEPSPHELDTARMLASNGLLCRFRAVSRVDYDRTSDVWIGTHAWEFKRPHGSGRNNINNVFNQASGQSRNLVIDSTDSPFGFDGVCEQASERLRWRDDFDELIVVDRTRMRRFTKS